MLSYCFFFLDMFDVVIVLTKSVREYLCILHTLRKYFPKLFSRPKSNLLETCCIEARFKKYLVFLLKTVFVLCFRKPRLNITAVLREIRVKCIVVSSQLSCL